MSGPVSRLDRCFRVAFISYINVITCFPLLSSLQLDLWEGL